MFADRLGGPIRVVLVNQIVSPSDVLPGLSALNNCFPRLFICLPEWITAKDAGDKGAEDAVLTKDWNDIHLLGGKQLSNDVFFFRFISWCKLIFILKV